jgi:hypothetical protein
MDKQTEAKIENLSQEAEPLTPEQAEVAQGGLTFNGQRSGGERGCTGDACQILLPGVQPYPGN